MFQVCVRDLFDFALAFVRSWPLIFEVEGRESGFGPRTSDSRTVRQIPSAVATLLLPFVRACKGRSADNLASTCSHCSVCSATDFGSMSNLAVALKMASLRMFSKGLVHRSNRPDESSGPPR